MKLMGRNFGWVFLGLAFLPSASYAGPSTSGGDTSLVCRNAKGEIETAEILDFYEARNRYSLGLASSTGSVAEDYLTADNRLRAMQQSAGTPVTISQQDAQKMVDLFLGLARFTGPGEKLPFLNDVGTQLLFPEGCSLEQLAIYHDDPSLHDYIEVDSKIWEKLDSLNRAGLIFHEFVYLRLRIFNPYDQKTSELSRAYVAQAFAATGTYGDMEGVPAGAANFLSADPSRWTNPGETPQYSVDPSWGNSTFHAYEVSAPSGKALRLSFQVVFGFSTLSLTYVDLPGVPTWKLKSQTRSILGVPYSALIVDEPNQDIDLEVPFHGVLLSGWTLELVYRSGEPVRLRIKQKSQVMADQILILPVSE